MTDWIRAWVLSLTGAALVCAAAQRLTPEGRVKPVVRLLCAVVMAAALFSPLSRGAELAAYPPELARYRARARELTAAGERTRQNMDRAIIERETEAYIMDKARALGVPLTHVKVSLRWSTEGVWLPESARFTGPYSAPLSRVVEGELGIPAAKQEWRRDESP